MATTIAMAACSTDPAMNAPSMDDDAPVSAFRAGSAPARFEQKLRERATSQGRQGRLAEAATSWEILTVLRPDAREYRDRLNETRRLIDATVPERLQRGAQALKRGELDAAASQYLAALALQPDNTQAADALRSIERERNKRSVLGRPSRQASTRRAVTDTRMPTPHAAAPSDRNVLEHAAVLSAQGEFDDAIALLERHLAVDRRDTTACRQLADMYYQKAEKQWPRDKPGALASLEKSQRIDASNMRAAQRLAQLKNTTVGTPGVATVAAREGCSSTR